MEAATITDLVTASPGGAGGDLSESIDRKRCSRCLKVQPRILGFCRSKEERDGRNRICRACWKEINTVMQPQVARTPRPPVERHPDIPARPKVPGKLTDDELLTLIFRDSGGGYVHTSEIAYQSGVRGPWMLAEQIERLRLAGFIASGRVAEWTVTDAGVAHLREVHRG